MNAPITYINCLGVNCAITHTSSVTQKNCFQIICVIISVVPTLTLPQNNARVFAIYESAKFPTTCLSTGCVFGNCLGISLWPQNQCLGNSAGADCNWHFITGSVLALGKAKPQMTGLKFCRN